jgi:hypothetical protein
VEDEAEAMRRDRSLQLAEQLGPQHDGAGRVAAVHVAEGRGEQVALRLAVGQPPGDGDASSTVE